MGHIELARWAELVLIAPASADFLARLAHGLADDLLCTLCLATERPDRRGAGHESADVGAMPATQANIATASQSRGRASLVRRVGDQACGEHGPGPHARADRDRRCRSSSCCRPAGPLSGRRVLVTAGPTRECIDPVRFVSNRSSGKMGFAVAQALREAGAEVMLVGGPVSLPTPPGVRRIDVESCRADVRRRAARTAGHRDLRWHRGGRRLPARDAARDQKIKKTSETLALEHDSHRRIFWRRSAASSASDRSWWASRPRLTRSNSTRAPSCWRRTWT